MKTYPYSVYSLTDGAVYDESAHADIEEAMSAYEGLLSSMKAERDENPDHWAESSVTLYNSFEGVLLLQECVATVPSVPYAHTGFECGAL